MKRIIFLIVAALSVSGLRTAMAGGDLKNLPLVYDPQTKKYFIGGTSRFVLKQGDESGLIDQIQVSVDGGDYRPYGSAVEFKTEGKHTIKFRAVNPVNNWSPVQFVEVFADLTPPTTEAKFSEDKYYQGGDKTYLGLNSTITLAAQDNLSGVASIEMSWDGTNFAPYTGPISIEKAGAQTLYYHSTDRVGNVEPVHKLEIIADGSAPVSELKLQGSARPVIMNGMSYLSDSVAYVINSTDDAAGVKDTWIALDGGKPQLYIKPLYFLEEGPHTLTYWSVDRVGNKETPRSLSLYSVSVPPHTSAVAIGKVVNTGGINYAKRDFQLKLEAKDNVVGLDHIEMKIDDEDNFRSYLDPISFKTMGFHTITYRAVDRAGNTEPARTYTVSLSESAPETTMATAQPLVVRDGVTYSPAPNVLTFNVGRSAVGVKETLVSIDDGTFQPYTGPLTVAADKKVHKVTYKSVDKLGNEENPQVAVFHMIGTMPIVDIFVSDGQNSEEQVRTNYLEKPADAVAPGANAAPRKPASAPVTAPATE